MSLKGFYATLLILIRTLHGCSLLANQRLRLNHLRVTFYPQVQQTFVRHPRGVLVGDPVSKDNGCSIGDFEDDDFYMFFFTYKSTI